MTEEAFRVIRPGLFTTVQDLGRTEGEDLGIPTGGAMDRRALQAANILAGNSRQAACLEITLAGPTLEILCDCRIAVCGAEIEIVLDGDQIPPNSGFAAFSGQSLRLGRCLRGARAFLAVSGGVAAEMVFGSRSTFVPAALGGHCGRRLCEGDVLRRDRPDQELPERRMTTSMTFADGGTALIRVLRGPQFHRLSLPAQTLFWRSLFTISPRSDRAGARLAGPPLRLEEALAGTMISEPAPLGSVQVSPDGLATVLLADRPTIGGYPKVVTVISADIGVMAQRQPGDPILFEEVTLEQAHALDRDLERELRILKWGVASRAKR